LDVLYPARKLDVKNAAAIVLGLPLSMSDINRFRN